MKTKQEIKRMRFVFLDVIDNPVLIADGLLFKWKRKYRSIFHQPGYWYIYRKLKTTDDFEYMESRRIPKEDAWRRGWKY